MGLAYESEMLEGVIRRCLGMQLYPLIGHSAGTRTVRLSLLSMFLATVLISGLIPFLQLIIIGLSVYFLGVRYSAVVLSVALIEGIAMGQVQSVIRFIDLWFQVTPPSRHLALAGVFAVSLVEASIFPIILARRFLSLLRGRIRFQ